MSPLFSYAVKSLARNRTRTIVTILGIMMSAGLIVALATLGTSLYHYVEEGYISGNGDWHIGAASGKWQDVESICGEQGVKEPFLAVNIGYAGLDTAVYDKPYLYLRGVQANYYEHMPIVLTEGHLPEREGEILLPENFGAEAGDRWTVGDIVTLEIGLRLKDGKALWQHVPYGYESDGVTAGSTGEEAEETLQQTKEHNYTVAGFYKAADDGIGVRKYDAPGYEALAFWDGEGAEDGYDRYSVWFQISGVGNAKFHEMYDRMRLVYGFDGSRLSVNLGLLGLYGVRIGSNEESAAAIAVAVILLIIILAGSVMLIYNAFAISVGERTRQFGLLSSVGATRKQIRASVLCEAAIVSGIGVLFGVGVGIALVAVVLKAAGETVADLMEFSGRPDLYVWVPAVLFAMALAVLTVLVSAWIPARRATRVTAIEAIRQSREFTYSGKKRKSAGWVENLFGIEGALAVTYSRRNRKRYQVTTFALFLSMVLFISINTFSGYMMTMIQTEYKVSNYDVLVQISPDQELTREEQSDLLQALREMEGVKLAAHSTYLSFAMPYQENSGHVTEKFGTILQDTSGMGTEYAAVAVVDDKSFSDFCEEHGLDEARFRNPKELTVIVKNQFKTTDKESGNTRLIEGLLEGDGKFYVDLASPFSGRENYQPDITEFLAGYYAESLAPGCNDNWKLSIMLPESLAETLGLQGASGNAYTYCLVAANHRRVAEEAKNVVKGYSGGSVYDLAERQAGNRNLVFMLKFLANGFMIMVALISMANVFSTISSSLRLRQKEFAMLKTVGMTQQGLRRMMNLECLMYGGKAVLFGLPVSVLLAAVMYYYFHKDVIFDFYLPVHSILIAIGCIFGVVFATMLYTMGRMKKENVMDVLKQESF